MAELLDCPCPESWQTLLDTLPPEQRECYEQHLESCPVCQRELPDDFTAPKAPSVLGSAKKEAERVRKTHDEAAGKAASEALSDGSP